MFLTNIYNKNQETTQCVCNSAESDRQEPPWDSNSIDPSPSYDSVYYEEQQFSNETGQPSTKPCQNSPNSSATPAVEIHAGSTTCIDLPPICWHGYNNAPKFFCVNNTGRNILINGQWSSGKPYIEGGPLNGSYMFSQIHFHSPSEHEIDGRRYPLEMHVVHYKTCYLTQERALEEKDGTLVLVYLFQVMDTDKTVLSHFTKEFSQIKNMNSQSEVAGISLNQIVRPFYSNYYIYWGSLSTEKNSYLLQWIINCSNLHATAQEVHDLFNLMESGELVDGRRTNLMKPVNDAVYFVGGYNMAYVDPNETTTLCSNCYSRQDLASSGHCHEHHTKGKKKKKKDIHCQTTSNEKCSVKDSTLTLCCKEKKTATEICEKAVMVESSTMACASEGGKKKKKKESKSDTHRVSVCSTDAVDLECKKSSEAENCVLVKVSSKTAACTKEKSPASEGRGKQKKKQKNEAECSKSKASNPKASGKQKEKKKNSSTEATPKSCKKEEKKKKKKTSTAEKCDLVSESKCAKVTLEECPKLEGKCSNLSVLSSNSKSKVAVFECNEIKETEGKKKKSSSNLKSPTDCTVNFLLTPNSPQSMPSLSLMTSESEGLKGIKKIKSTKSNNFEVLEKILNRAYTSNYELPLPKTKEPLTEFFLQTEHFFRAEKNADFSMCISQDYSVAIIYNQNILQEFKGTFYPNKLKLGSHEKLDLQRKYPDPENLIVRLEECNVKMESVDQLYIRAKFLLKKIDFNVVQNVGNEFFEESQRLINPETRTKLSDTQQKIENCKECDQLISTVRFKNPQYYSSPSEDEIQEESNDELISNNREYEIELLEDPSHGTETSKSIIFDCAEQPRKTKVEKEESRENLIQKSHKTLKNLFCKRKRVIYFTYEKLEKDENTGKKVLVGKFRTKNELKALSKDKKPPQNNEPYVTSEKSIETESFISLSNKELVLEELLSHQSPTEQQEPKIHSFDENKEPEKMDNGKDIIILHKYNPENFKPKCPKSESKSTAFQDQDLVITSDIHFPQDEKSEKPKFGSLMVKIQTCSKVKDSQIPQIMVLAELDTRNFKKTNKCTEVIFIRYSKF